MAITKFLGDVITVTVPVQNTGSMAGTAYVRVSLVLPPAVTGLDLPDTVSGLLDAVVTLNPGQTANVVFSGVIPAGASLGSYDTVGIVRTGPDLTGSVIADSTEPAQVDITGVFAVSIGSMVES